MPQIDEPTTPAPSPAPETKKPRPAPAAKTPSGVYSFTVDTGTGRIVTVASVDRDGVHHRLTPDEKAKLAGAAPAMPVRRLVEQAFEAGIEFVLGEDAGKDSPESKEERELSTMLLKTMIERSKVGELIKGDTLHRSVIDTLIAHAAK